MRIILTIYNGLHMQCLDKISFLNCKYSRLNTPKSSKAKENTIEKMIYHKNVKCILLNSLNLHLPM